MIYELHKPTGTGYYVKCSRCGYRDPPEPGKAHVEQVYAEQAERLHNLQAHGIAPKGFKP
jgi:hypothetical protein